MQEGCLGLRMFDEVQSAFRMKQVWFLLKGSSLWAKVFSTKFLKGRSLIRCMRKTILLVLNC